MTEVAEQIAWQRQAVRVLAGLLELAARENLPVLSWEVGPAGVTLVGRSTVWPHTARRDAITVWAAAVGITLRETRRTGTVSIMGTAKQQEFPGGWATVTLTCLIYDEEPGGAGGDDDGLRGEAWPRVACPVA